MKFGIYNTMKREFQFGIVADTPREAKRALFKKIGRDAYKWRFDVRPLKEDKHES